MLRHEASCSNRFGRRAHSLCNDRSHILEPDDNIEDQHIIYSYQSGKVSYGATPGPATLPTTPLQSSDENGHCHQDRDEGVDPKAKRKLIIASVVCVIFMIIEIIGGYLSSSLAIATDAAHLLTDLVAFMISLFAIWMAGKPATRTMSFGWYRAEVIGALTSVLTIWLITGVLVYLAIERVMTNDFEIDAKIMLITSSIGVLVNIIMGCTLHDFGHGHGGHGHSHGGHSHGGHKKPKRSSGIENPALRIEEGLSQDEDVVEASETTNRVEIVKPKAKREGNINVRAAFIHVIGDFLQSFGVFVAALVIYYKPEWSIVDPICTFLFSILVMFTTFTIIRDALRVLMEAAPKGLDFQEVCNTFLSLPGVVRVHNLRMWALSLDKTALAAHLAISPGTAPQKVLEDATKLIRQNYDFFELTLQIEEFHDDMEMCHQCKIPTE